MSDPQPATDGAASTPATTLSALPPPPSDKSGGYVWVAVYVGLVWLALLGLSTKVWLDAFGFDPARGATWSFVTSLMIVTPGCLVVALASFGVLVLLRKLGARRWPAPIQALPAVVLVLGLAWLILRITLSARMY